MDKNDLKRLADNTDFIPGIYNYCDRWCERCPLTSRCMNYAMGAELEAEHGASNNDPTNEAFWQQIADSLQATFDLIQEVAEEQHLDLDAFDGDDMKEAMDRRETNRENAKDDEITRRAAAYIAMVDKWFDGAETVFAEKGGELEQIDQLEIAGVDIPAEVAALSDAVEVIRWYQYQIQVKAMRAVSSSLNERDEEIEWNEEDVWVPEFEGGDDEEEDMGEYQKDSDGSAKVALIGVDRSIAAWSRMLAVFPAQEDSLLPILVHLERLRRTIERRFPDARAFVRPGFDQPDA